MLFMRTWLAAKVSQRLTVRRSAPTMAFVIIEACIDVKDGSCTEVCPVDCIYEGGRMYYIQPEECINCGLCLSVCPVDAIRSDEDLSSHDQPFAAINREFFADSVSGIGSPGGWAPHSTVRVDHPEVAARPHHPAT